MGNNEEDSTSDCDSVTVEDSSLVCTLQPVPAVSPCSSEADITSPTLPSPVGSGCAVWIAAEYSFDASYKQVTSRRCSQQMLCLRRWNTGTGCRVRTAQKIWRKSMI